MCSNRCSFSAVQMNAQQMVPGEYWRGPDRRPEHRPVIIAGATRPQERDAEGKYRPADQPGASIRALGQRPSHTVIFCARNRSVMPSATKAAQVRLNRVTPSHCRVVLDNPPLNLMGPEFVLQIREIVTALENDDRVKVVVFESAVRRLLSESLRLPREVRGSDQHPARSDRPRSMARRPGAPDARSVRFDRADPGAGDRKRQ